MDYPLFLIIFPQCDVQVPTVPVESNRIRMLECHRLLLGFSFLFLITHLTASRCLP